MYRRQFLSLICAAAAALVAFGGSNRAQADIALQLSDGVFTTSIPNVSGNPALITFSGMVGQYSVTLTAGASKATGELDITNLQVTRNSIATPAANLTINLSANNYVLPPGSPLGLSSSPSATFTTSTAGDSVTFKSWGNSANTLAFATGTATGLSTITSPGGTTPSLGGPATTATFATAGAYALNSQMVIHLATTTSNDTKAHTGI